MTFNKEQSYYVTAKDSLEKADRINNEKVVENENGGGNFYLGMKVSSQGDQVVNNINKKTMWSGFLHRKYFYMKEVTPKFIWKITNEKKDIGKFKCKKATTSFRGRNYIAWFTTEIGVPYGPWKLQGLPGLILEAYDTNKSVYWYFKSVEYPTKNKENVNFIRKSKKEKSITFSDYDGYKKFMSDEEKKVEEKNILMKKEYPDIVFLVPKLEDMFIEFK